MAEWDFLFFAFTAGAVSFFNPCGFGLLSVYVSKYFEKRHAPAGFAKNSLEGLTAGAVATLGFILLFSIAGLAIKAGFRAFIPFLPFVLAVMGVAFVLAGISKLLGRPLPLHFTLPLKAASLESPRSFFYYGILYGVGSLGCALPIFLIVVTGGLALSLEDAFLAFLSYSLGMGVPLTAVTVSIALSKTAVMTWARDSLGLVDKLSALLLVGGGAYLWYYLWKIQAFAF